MNVLYFLLLLTVCAIPASGQSITNNDFINSYAHNHTFSGTILIQKRDSIQFNKSYGFANLQFKVPNTTQTKYKIASITKLFTATLVMQLYEQGKIDLDVGIKKYLPDYTGAGAEQITIRHLLTHTSGLPYVGPTSKQDALDNGMEELQLPHSVDEIINNYYSSKPVNPPGTSFSYSNGEYIMLGRIIENMYQASFAEVLDEQILKPLDMHDSGLLFQYQIIDHLADSYFTMNDSSGLVNDLPVYIQNWYSAGAMYSISADLMKFNRALFSGKLLKPESMKMLLEPGLDQYGFGIWIYDQEVQGRKYRVFKRPGDIMGSRGQFVYLPDLDVGIIMLANTDVTDLDDFVHQIINHLRETL